MGSTTYYQSTITARELAGVARTAGELEDWTSWSIFERFQRKLAITRVRREIVPYLVKTRDRFFGAFIILVFEPNVFEFEPMTSDALPTGLVYGHAAERMGFLTIEGGSLVTLDGQHRLVSLREVINAGDELKGAYRDDVASDEVSVMFVRHESFEKTRRIFNKVNRYAKQTSTSDNIITSEDDGYSLVTRWLVEDTPPLGLTGPYPPLGITDASGEPIVDWEHDRLKIESPKFTTLSHLYQTVRHILDANGIRNFDEKHRVNRPPDCELIAAYQASAQWWGSVLAVFDNYRLATESPILIPALRRGRQSLLFRPVVQVALFHGLSLAVRRGVDLHEAIRRATRIRWSARSKIWVDVIIGSNGKMKTRTEAVRNAGHLVEYLIAGSLLDSVEIGRLEGALRDETDRPRYRLPKAYG